MKVSLVTTVKDAAEHVGDFLASVRAQTRPPDEIVVVDGGSTDGTLERLRSESDILLLEEPGAGIARGRNVAIRAATHELIAVSDADCILSPAWLERLAAALEAGADVAMGFTRPLYHSFFEACSAAVSLPETEEVDPNAFMPSSRSIAFHREAIELAGGYPDWLPLGEDMHLDHRFRELAMDMVFVPEAVAHWRIRPTLRALWSQYAGYAWGDGYAGMYPGRHALRFAVYGTTAWALASRRTNVLAVLALASSWYATRRLRRAFRLLPGRPAERLSALGAVPALMAFVDLAKMAGYVQGRLARRHR